MFIGKWLNIPVYIHWSLAFIILLLFIVSPQTLPVYVGLFVIILLHEFGHCIAAKKYNREIEKITLYPIGGVASIDLYRITPWEEFVIVIWGPLINLILIGPLYFLYNLYSNDTFESLFKINIIIMLFNLLLPAFPMDGGRIFRSILSGKTGDHLWATKIAVILSQISSAVMFMCGFYYSNMMLVVISIFVFFGSKAELLKAKEELVGDFSQEVVRSSRNITDIQMRIDEHETKFS